MNAKVCFFPPAHDLTFRSEYRNAVKNKKLALIAVCNKLLKHAFAIVKPGVLYQTDFSSKLTLIP